MNVRVLLLVCDALTKRQRTIPLAKCPFHHIIYGTHPHIHRRFRSVTPLFLAAEPLLREWLQQLERGQGAAGADRNEKAGPGGGVDRHGSREGTRGATRPGPILSAVDLAHAVSRVSHDHEEMADVWARVLAQEHSDEAQQQQQKEEGPRQEAPHDDDPVLRPLLLFCCALGDDGFLEALAPLLFRLQPTSLVHLVARLAEPDMQPRPFQPLGDVRGPPPRHDFYYRAHFLAAPDSGGAREESYVPPSNPEGESWGDPQGPARREGSGLGLNPWEAEQEQEGVGEGGRSSHGDESINAVVSVTGQAAQEEQEQEEEDEGESQLRASRAVYARALCLVRPPSSPAGPGAGPREEGEEEQEAAYRALLEGAGRFVCLARRLVLPQQRHRDGGGDGWAAALALLHRLRAASCVRTHHQVFVFLLAQALGSPAPARVEGVMACRPAALTVADVWALARRMRQEEQERTEAATWGGAESDSPRLCVASLKHCVILLMQAQQGGRI